MKFFEWLGLEPSPIARDDRYPRKLTASYWNGGTSTGAEVRDISESGAYLITSERWYLGTILSLTLQFEAGENGTKTPQTMTVLCKIARHEQDGMGVYFMFAGSKDRKALQRFIAEVPCRETSPVVSSEGGQSLIEFALMVPLLLLLIVNAVNFGGFFYSWITVSNAARAGAQYGILGGASAGNPTSATTTLIQNLITADTSTLPSGTSASVCVNKNATSAAVAGTCSFTIPNIPADPDTPSYVSMAVDVKYTYQPFIPGFNFPAFHIHATLPPTAIQVRTLMRMIQ